MGLSTVLSIIPQIAPKLGLDSKQKGVTHPGSGEMKPWNIMAYVAI